MSGDAETVSRESPYATDKLRVHGLLSGLTILVGVVLLVYMIYAESEPGAIPLLMVALGTGWYVVTRARSRSRTSHITRNN